MKLTLAYETSEREQIFHSGNLIDIWCDMIGQQTLWPLPLPGNFRRFKFTYCLLQLKAQTCANWHASPLYFLCCVFNLHLAIYHYEDMRGNLVAAASLWSFDNEVLSIQIWYGATQTLNCCESFRKTWQPLKVKFSQNSPAGCCQIQMGTSNGLIFPLWLLWCWL